MAEERLLLVVLDEFLEVAISCFRGIDVVDHFTGVDRLECTGQRYFAVIGHRVVFEVALHRTGAGTSNQQDKYNQEAPLFHA